jgi:hypothetical protein
MLATLFSLLLYGAAALAIIATLGLAVLARKGRTFLYGHIGVGLGFALAAVSLGVLIGNELSASQRALVFTFGIAGYALLCFSRKRQREVDRFIRVANEGKDRQSNP